MLNISIPQPCHEDWNAMTPTEKGAFCAVCTKEVMDFSNMSDDEVKNYFLLNAGKRTCGRFRKSQLKGLNIVVDEQVIYTSIALWKKFLAAVVICFGMFLASCTTDIKGKETQGKEASEIGALIVLPDSAKSQCSYPETVVGKIMKEPPLPNKSNSTITVETYVTGDIAPPPAIEPVREPVVAAAPLPDPMPIDTLKKIVDTCSNPKFL